MRILVLMLGLPFALGTAWAQDNLILAGKADYGTPQWRLLHAHGLGEDEVASGFREVLRVAAARTVARLGRSGGFEDDPDLRISLPARIGTALDKIGGAPFAHDLESRLNRAAEAATAGAGPILAEAIGRLRFDEPYRLLVGPTDGATRALRQTAFGGLAAALRPLLDQSLTDAGAVRAWAVVRERLKPIPDGGSADLDLTSFLAGRAWEAIFIELGRQEALIRADPAARSTDPLHRLFSQREGCTRSAQQS